MAFTKRFEDTFVEAGAGTELLTNHTPDTTGVSWTSLSGNPGSNATIDESTDVVYQPFHSGNLRYNGYTADISGTWADDQRAERTLSVLSNSLQCAVAVRCQEDGVDQRLNGYGMIHFGSTNNWRIHRYDSGVATVLENVFDSSPLTTDVIIMEVVGTAQRMYENGSAIGSGASDSTYSSGGSPGFGFQRSGSASSGYSADFNGYDEGAAAAGNPWYYFAQMASILVVMNWITKMIGDLNA